MRIRVFLRKAWKYVKNPRNLYIRFAIKRLRKKGNEMSDEEYISRFFKIKMGKKLDLSNPITFNEKLNYLKLFDRNDKYTIMVDKHAAKQYVSKLLGSEYVAKEYAVWNRIEDFDILSLPNSFVLKTTHGCGGMLIVKNKKEFNYNEFYKKIVPSLSSNYYYHCREWPYKNVPPRIIAEEFLKDDRFDVLPVYKFFCFNGEPFILQAIQNDKHENETIDYFDMNWQKLKLKQNFPNSKKPLTRPQTFEEMKDCCVKLSKGIPFVRCDFYEVNNKVYFSEFTFYSDAGFEKFYPKKWDLKLGQKIQIQK